MDIRISGSIEFSKVNDFGDVMSKLLIVKTADSPGKEVGDIIRVDEASHVYSDHELAVFDVVEVKGLDKAQVTDRFYNVLRPPIDKYEVWYDSDKDLWYLIQVDPRNQYSISGLSQDDIDVLESPTSTQEETLEALDKIKFKVKFISDNSKIKIKKEDVV